MLTCPRGEGEGSWTHRAGKEGMNPWVRVFFLPLAKKLLEGRTIVNVSASRYYSDLLVQAGPGGPLLGTELGCAVPPGKQHHAALQP